MSDCEQVLLGCAGTLSQVCVFGKRIAEEALTHLAVQVPRPDHWAGLGGRALCGPVGQQAEAQRPKGNCTRPGSRSSLSPPTPDSSSACCGCHLPASGGRVQGGNHSGASQTQAQLGLRSSSLPFQGKAGPAQQAMPRPSSEANTAKDGSQLPQVGSVSTLQMQTLWPTWGKDLHPFSAAFEGGLLASRGRKSWKETFFPRNVVSVTCSQGMAGRMGV